MDVDKKLAKRRYAVQHGDTIKVFKNRLEEAIAYWQARPGSALVYKAHGKWGGQVKRSTRWLPVPQAELETRPEWNR